MIEFGPDCVARKADAKDVRDVKEGDFPLGLYHSVGGQKFFVCAESEQDREAWIAALNNNAEDD